ncbi:MAG: S8 family serine peptidase [Bacteroidia bacterium]|nr:S8 family serine peptidase [Bacteroidia bacterium]MDW8157436.1 S8 family serine peptidase [Bacteroidia bacterium]
MKYTIFKTFSFTLLFFALLALNFLKSQILQERPILEINQARKFDNSPLAPEVKKGELFFRVVAGIEENIPIFNNIHELDNLVKNNGVPEYWQRVYKEFGVQAVEKAFKIKTERLQRYFKITFTEHHLQEELEKQLKNLPGIEHVEGIPIYRLFSQPNDIHPTQWGLSRINALGAWTQTTGRSKVVVAIVDDAVKITHQDLRDVIYRNPNEIPNNGIDDDQNGYIDDINGWDAGDNDNNPNPPIRARDMIFSHGTHCAGIAGATTNNGKGIASIGHNISILPVKAADDNSSGTGISDGYLGVQYAIIAGADVISMSWGGAASSQAIQDLFNYANSIGIVLVAAAGNNNQNQRIFPCAYNHVICVASTDFSDRKSDFSNYGTWVDVSAPGEYIYSTVATHDSAYFYYDGTSMATPLVAGLCALMKSYNPSLTPAQIESCLKSTADNIDNINPNFRGLLGAGRINASAAIQCAAPPKLDLGFIQRIQNGVALLCENQENIQITLLNSGSERINHFTIRYSVGANNWQTQNVSANIEAGEEYIFVMPLPRPLPSAGNYEIRAEILSVNGSADQNIQNNTLLAFLRIPKIENLTCGSRFTGTTTNAPQINSRYNCNANRNETGPEVYHRIVISEKGILTITLSGATTNTHVYLLSACFPNRCVNFGTATFSTFVEPGTYYIVVESPNAQGTNYTLSTSCQPLACNTSSTATISCGTPVQGQLTGNQNILNNYNCGATGQNAAERIHRIIINEPTTLSVQVSTNTTNATIRALVLSNCDPATCLGSALGTAIGSNQILTLPSLQPGEYFIVVDGTANGNYTLLVNCISCSNPIPLQCGVPYSGTTAGGVNRINTYNCSTQNLSGSENVHQITVTEAGILRAQLRNANPNMRVILLDNCNSQRCLAISDTALQVFVPNGGTYTIVVDATTLVSAGAYQLTVDCLPYRCPTPINLNCGQTYNGNTANGTRTISRYNCVNRLVAGPEVFHAIQINAPSIITATLSNLNTDQDVFILSACNPNQCIAFGDNTATATLERPGTYYVVVDGNTAGTYRLQVNCVPINCGNTAVDIQCGARYQGSTATSRNNRTTYPCLPGINFGAPEVIHRIRVTQRTNLIARLQPSNANAQFVMFWQTSCDPNSCINFGLGQLQLMNVNPGEYFLVIDAQTGTQGDYTLLVTCENMNCSNPIALSCGQDIEYRGTTSGKARNTTFYPCKPSSFSFGGEEILVFRPEFSGYVELQFRSQANAGALDLMLLSGCNAATCMGFWSGVGPINEKIYVEANNTYYLVVDGSVNGQNIIEGAYALKIKCPCPTIRVKGPDRAVCSGTPFTLNVEGYDGKIRWYESSTTTIPSFIGNSYQVNGLTTHTRFFAEPDKFCNLIQRATFDVVVTPSPKLTVTPDAATICKGQSITLKADGDADAYHWSPTIDLSSSEGKVVIASPSSSIDYTVTAQKLENNCSTQKIIPITVTPVPQPEIYQQQDFLFVRNYQQGIQWLRNSIPIPGATQPQYQVTETGWYSVEVTAGPANCKGRSDSLFVQLTSIKDLKQENSSWAKCYPNPTTGLVTLSFVKALQEKGKLIIYNTLGQKVGAEEISPEAINYTLNITTLPNGTYRLFLEQGVKIHKIASIIKQE